MEYKKLIKKGTSDAEAVKAIKAKLNSTIGSTLDVANGNFGDSTVNVVKQFQRRNQLLPDGVVGELTWERLFTPSVEIAPHSKTLSLRAIEIMDTQLYVREKTGNNDGVEVEEYLKYVGLPAGYAWCMAFVFWGFQKAYEDLNIRNPVPRTAGVLDCYRKAQLMGYEVFEPEVGDQFILDFGGGKGHTGMVTELRSGKKVLTVEGNTSADPSYAAEDREGNGVFERLRPIGKMKFLRYT